MYDNAIWGIEITDSSLINFFAASTVSNENKRAHYGY